MLQPARHQLPPSPPLSPKHSSNADHLFETIRGLAAGRRPKAQPRPAQDPNLGEDQVLDQYTFSLSLAALATFESRLQANADVEAWFRAHARYDYIADKETFVLRMPSIVHEDFIAFFDRNFTNVVIPQLRAHSEQCGELRVGRSRTLDFQKSTGEGGGVEEEEEAVAGHKDQQQEAAVRSIEQAEGDRTPDATIVYNNYYWPALVAEVSYSQQSRALPKLADDYLLDSNFNIRCVLGFDIPTEYQRQRQNVRTAAVFLWRPDFNAQGEAVSKVHLNAPFRDAAGTACAGGLSLTLADLLPQAVYASLPQDTKDTAPPITIPFAMLSQWLDTAERKPYLPRTAPLRKRRRTKTPEEELDEQREGKFRKQEQRVETNHEKADESWKGGPQQSSRHPELPRRSSRRTREKPSDNT